MKRSINSENIIVVTVLALAISLLASACGSNKTKTLRTRANGGLEKIQTTEEKVIQVENENAKISGEENTTVISDAVDFAKRVSYIQYKENGPDVTLRAAVLVNGKPYYINFSDAQVLTDDKKTIGFTKNISKEILNGGEKLAEKAIRLNLYAQTQKIGPGEAIVTLSEDDIKVSAVVKLSSAKAEVQSNDKNILLMTDAKITTRTTQLYYKDAAKNELQKLDSVANRIFIDVKSSQGNELYSLLSRLDIKGKSMGLQVNRVAADYASSFDANKFDLVLNSDDSIINANKLAIEIKSKDKANVNSNSTVLLTLSSSNDAKKEDDKNNAEAEKNTDSTKNEDTEKKEQTETKPTMSMDTTQFDYSSTPDDEASSAKPDFSNVKGGVSSTEKIKPDFSNVKSGTSSTEKVTKPDFSNVRGSSSSTAKKPAQKATQVPYKRTPP